MPLLIKVLIIIKNNFFQALEQANQAKTSATDASVKVKNALDTVEDILRALGKPDPILNSKQFVQNIYYSS